MFTARRNWDEESIKSFNAKRDEKRVRTGQRPFHSLSAEERQAQAHDEKKPLVDEQWNKLTSQACPLEKYPLQQAIAPCDGVLLCPQIFRPHGAIRGPVPATKISFRKGQDLFVKAYYYYSEPPGNDERVANNYVSNDTISPRRHEYLGPAPRVSGFYLQENEAQILFFDSNLKLAWTGYGTWALGAEYDKTVEAFIPVIQMKES